MVTRRVAPGTAFGVADEHLSGRSLLLWHCAPSLLEVCTRERPVCDWLRPRHACALRGLGADERGDPQGRVDAVRICGGGLLRLREVSVQSYTHFAVDPRVLSDDPAKWVCLTAWGVYLPGSDVPELQHWLACSATVPAPPAPPTPPPVSVDGAGRHRICTVDPTACPDLQPDGESSWQLSGNACWLAPEHMPRPLDVGKPENQSRTRPGILNLAPRQHAAASESGEGTFDHRRGCGRAARCNVAPTVIYAARRGRRAAPRADRLARRKCAMRGSSRYAGWAPMKRGESAPIRRDSTAPMSKGTAWRSFESHWVERNADRHVFRVERASMAGLFPG